MRSYGALLTLEIILFFLIILKFPSQTFALTISLDNPSQTTISEANQEFSINLSLKGTNIPNDTKYYLRGVFYLPDSTNYCGFTWNGNSWFSAPYSTGEGWKNFLAVSVASNSASVQLKAKIDTADSGCRASGSYNFKVQRFTEAGSATFDDQNIQTVVFSLPNPIPSPTEPPQPTKVPSLKPTVKVNNTHVSTVTSEKPIFDNSVEPTLTIPAAVGLEYLTTVNNSTSQAKSQSSDRSVLGANTGEDSFDKEIIVKDVGKNSQKRLILLLIGGGTIMILAAIIISIYKIKNRQVLSD